MAYTQPIKWHYNNLNWVKYYRASSLVQLERYEEAENEFISLGNKIPNVDSFEVLYQLYMNTGKEKEAYTNLIYKFFTAGYSLKQLSLYEKVFNIVKDGKNPEVAALANALIYKIKAELETGRKKPLPACFGFLGKYIYVPITAVVFVLGILYGGIG